MTDLGVIERSDGVILVPQPHGGALRIGGPGRPVSKAGQAIKEARSDLMASLDALRAIRDAGMCKHCGRGTSSADEVVKACLGLIRLSGVDRDRPKPRKRSTFSVVRATPAEQAAKMAGTARESELAETDPDLGAPR